MEEYWPRKTLNPPALLGELAEGPADGPGEGHFFSQAGPAEVAVQKMRVGGLGVLFDRFAHGEGFQMVFWKVLGRAGWVTRHRRPWHDLGEAPWVTVTAKS